METSTIIIIAAATVIFDVALIFFILKRRKAQQLQLHSSIESEAHELGWQYSREGSQGILFTLTGVSESGTPWELQVSGPGRNSSRKGRTIWQTQDIQLSDAIIAIGPISSQKFQATDIDLSHRLIQAALRRIFGKELATALSDANLISLENPELAREYMLLANDREIADRFLASPVADILIDWTSSSDALPAPAITVWKGGVSIRISGIIKDIDSCRKIIALGQVLALRTKDISR